MTATRTDWGCDMADLNFPKWAPSTRDERRPRPEDYRSGASARTRPADRPEVESPAMNEPDAPFDRTDEMTAGTAVNLRKLQEHLSRKPLDEIAILVHSLTYGEMIELCEAIWRSQPEGSDITQENLPALLHRWSKSRPAAVSPPPEELPPA
jgi:hypothetical protein